MEREYELLQKCSKIKGEKLEQRCMKKLKQKMDENVERNQPVRIGGCHNYSALLRAKAFTLKKIKNSIMVVLWFSGSFSRVFSR